MTPAAEIIKRLTAVFGEPKTNDPALFLEEFEKAMRGYSRDARPRLKARRERRRR